jgi:NADPH-dependent curcumin reductase CurA
MAENMVVRLVKRPSGMVTPDCFTILPEAVGEPADGEITVKVAFVSLDPAMRGWMVDRKSYIPPIGLGEIMRAGIVGEVVKSNAPQFSVGEFVSGWGGAAQYFTGAAGMFTKVDPTLAPLERLIGGLGMPGLTAYFGLLDVGAMQPGETVVVSGASGAVGAMVGQIAKIKGGKVIGIAGGPEKCAYCTDTLGFDACIDYKSEDVDARLGELIPRGLDVYFDNVGGEILEACMNHLRMKARVVICGAISIYNATEMPSGPRNYLNLLVQSARMEGFVVTTYAARAGEAVQTMAAWMNDGKLQFKEDVQVGIERFPEVFNMLFTGENFGKLLLKVG